MKGSTHEGNRRFRQLVLDKKAAYLNAHARATSRKVITRRVVEIVHESGGQFLRKATAADEPSDYCSDNKGGFWVKAHDKWAIAKTTTALREWLEVDEEPAIHRAAVGHIGPNDCLIGGSDRVRSHRRATVGTGSSLWTTRPSTVMPGRLTRQRSRAGLSAWSMTGAAGSYGRPR